MGTLRVAYRDPFKPVLLSADSQALTLSKEQNDYIHQVLAIACSDSKFAQKAYDAVQLILTTGQVKVPTISSLTPGSATIGDPSFTLHVHGTNLLEGSTIIFAGQEEPTTHVSDTELTTGVDMSVWHGPDTLSVLVSSPDGAFSESTSFVFEASPSTRSTSPSPSPSHGKK
jgi:hypothetical protein